MEKKIFCTDCHAVYFGAPPLDGCYNLLCTGDTLLIDDENFDLLEAMKKRCCDISIAQHVNLLGSVYFLELGLLFCTETAAQNFYEYANAVVDSLDKFDNINLYVYSSEDQYIVTVEYPGGCDDLLYLEDMERVLEVMRFRDALKRIFIPELTDKPVPEADLKLPVKAVATGEI